MPTRLTVCFPCVLLFVVFVITCFGFGGWVRVLVASVSVICMLFVLAFSD